ncbi:unnamed protein product [Euphydryas editha]|uniref:Uncharacterized protein n=1 Tax=Euphydryas editha TaxID=104508 RepID=A0AAU9TSV3_EUPED|nr:unnamed protein product [Euphydryas editha]
MFHCIVQPRHDWGPPDLANAFPGKASELPPRLGRGPATSRGPRVASLGAFTVDEMCKRFEKKNVDPSLLTCYIWSSNVTVVSEECGYCVDSYEFLVQIVRLSLRFCYTDSCDSCALTLRRIPAYSN